MSRALDLLSVIILQIKNILNENFTWLNRVGDVNDSIVAMVLRPCAGLVDNQIREQRLFSDDFFREINSI